VTGSVRWRHRCAMSSQGAATALSQGIETPMYVYDLDEVNGAYERLHASLPAPSTIYYSVKANPHPRIVERLGSLGAGLEVSSPGELALCPPGLDPSRVLYTGPARHDDDVRAALRAGVRWFSVESPTSLDQVDRVAREAGLTASCLLRINPPSPARGQSLRMTGVASQFGADHSWVLRQPQLFRPKDAADVGGFHIYMGSNVLDEQALLGQFTLALRCAAEAADALGVTPRLLDLGGGFGAPYGSDAPSPVFPGLREELSARLDTYAPGWREQRTRVIFESGRFLTSTCGSLLARVLEIKESRGQAVVILESGINHLGGMSGLRRLLPLSFCLVPATSQARGASTGRASAMVVGPLCTPLDLLTKTADLDGIEPGDVVRVPNVGAYGLSASLVAFLGHPLPREVVVERGKVIDVSRLELVRRAV
jgi:diaminopimelate decarboxylase